MRAARATRCGATSTDLSGLPLPVMNEIEHFFQVYKDLEGHEVSTDGFEDRAAADAVIERARDRFADAGG